jgi:rRNA maturation endonuclease Nob1
MVRSGNKVKDEIVGRVKCEGCGKTMHHGLHAGERVPEGLECRVCGHITDICGFKSDD